MSENMMTKMERTSLSLRSLYKKYGYLPYKMSKFEAYDLYVRNKDFLHSDGVITFNDTDGKLLALKPDVTLSIIKNGSDETNLQKVYYDENVYRISGETKQFKELKQVGLECIGEIGEYETYETVILAAQSLAEISSAFVLDISHLGVLSGVLAEAKVGAGFTRELTKCLAGKNLHETKALCARFGVDESVTEKICTVLQSYGDMKTVLEKLASVCQNAESKCALDELTALYNALKNSPFANNIRFDFSVVNDMKYYNGIVFKGFVDGVCEGVLSGGRYDGLTARMGRKAQAIGFAVYLDLLESTLGRTGAKVDIDTLVLYDETTTMEEIVASVAQKQSEGKSVRVQRRETGLRFGELVDLRK